MTRRNYGNAERAPWSQGVWTSSRSREARRTTRPYIVCQHCAQGWKWANAHKQQHCYNCYKPYDPPHSALDVPRHVSVNGDAAACAKDDKSVISAVLHTLLQDPKLAHVAEAVRAAAASTPVVAPTPPTALQAWDESRRKCNAAQNQTKNCEVRAGKLATQINAAKEKLATLVEQQKENDNKLTELRGQYDQLYKAHNSLPVPHGEVPQVPQPGAPSDDMAVDLDERFKELLNPGKAEGGEFTDEKKEARLNALRELFLKDSLDAKRRKTEKAEERPGSVEEAEAAKTTATASAEEAARAAAAEGNNEPPADARRGARSRSPRHG